MLLAASKVCLSVQVWVCSNRGEDEVKEMLPKLMIVSTQNQNQNQVRQ